MDSERLLGIALLVAGALGANLTMRRFERDARHGVDLLAIVPMGALIGAGAATVRGWNLIGTTVTGAVLVPLIAVVTRLWDVRRRSGTA